MLKTIDRGQIATAHAAETAAMWVRSLEAEPAGTDRVAALAAKRTTCRVGRGVVEFLEPDGAGPIEEALARRKRPHLYAAGASCVDVAGLAQRLQARGVQVVAEGDQVFFDLAPVLGVAAPMVVSPWQERQSVGLIDYLYEVTLLADDVAARVARFADAFGLAEDVFQPIASETFGYEGVLTLFADDALHRFEIIHPYDREKTMGRFFGREGACYYMCFAETPGMTALEARAAEVGGGITIERPETRATTAAADQMWLHPPALGGVMMGLSRPSMAWRWSGHPERVQPL